VVVRDRDQRASMSMDDISHVNYFRDDEFSDILRRNFLFKNRDSDLFSAR